MVATGMPETITTGLGTLGIAWPPCEHNTVAPTCKIGPGIYHFLSLKISKTKTHHGGTEKSNEPQIDADDRRLILASISFRVFAFDLRFSAFICGQPWFWVSPCLRGRCSACFI
jgi:hypothetical protein